MAKTKFQCWVELDQSGELISTCYDENGLEISHPINAKKGDDFVWHASKDVESIVVTYYVGSSKATACSKLPFAQTSSIDRKHKGTELNDKCADKVSQEMSYQVDAVLLGGETITLDPIIIVGKQFIATDFLVAAVWLLPALVVVAVAYRIGRMRERRMRLGGTSPPPANGTSAR